MIRTNLPAQRRASLRWACRATLLLGAVSASLGACSGDEPSGDQEPEQLTDVNVEVSYPSEAAQSVTAVLHAWVLVAGEGAQVDEDAPKFNCASLVGGTLDPYDLTLVRLADVASTEDVTRVTAQPVVTPGEVLVYVEAGGFDGVAEFAGCTTAALGAAPVSASVELGRAKIFDCADPDTEDGSPCDDGLLCTVGETCNAGTCSDGVPRTCSFAADGCHAGTCDETDGCVVEPLADGTPCDDGQFCTQGDVCSAGECTGSARDCSAEADTCLTVLGCDEGTDSCITTPAPFGTSCDDGLFCTEFDQCNGAGSCTGSTRDCSVGLGSCEVSAGCDEAGDACLTANATVGTPCDDGLYCTDSDQCDGAGTCTGSALDCSAFDDECVVGVCQEASLGSCSAEPLPEGTTCDDANGATFNDACDGSGICAGDPI